MFPIQLGTYCVPMSEEHEIAFILTEHDMDTVIPLCEKNGKYIGTYEGISYALSYIENSDEASITVDIQNGTDKVFAPVMLSLRLGIDSYMVDYPQWSDKLFPTFLRCEKTHFHGYFMSPEGNIVCVGCSEPIASYSLEYNKQGDGFGHRIYTARLQLINSLPLPERYPKITYIAAGKSLHREIKLFTINNLDTYESEMSNQIQAPIAVMSRYTVAKGERLYLKVYSQEKYSVKAILPNGREVSRRSLKTNLFGEYRFCVTDKNGKSTEVRAFCHKPWRAYLDKARDAAFAYPQKATTHAESYYGFYSAFLAAKHMPNPKLDQKLVEHFCEVAPLMFDMDKCEPILIPQRIQNSATMLGILVDLYESNSQKFEWALDKASGFADYLMSCQTEDGVYRRGHLHYTCVIYIAKSMLELALAEKLAGHRYASRYRIHYESVQKAIDDLVLRLDNIGTEGESTFEDGMISCSALQIAMFALTLPEQEREPYTKAAEYMLEKHRCLENTKVPDYRMNGGSLRFWEAQYDVMIHANFMNSPHGWTAWTAYATYYLYLLTGKETYLVQTYNTMGACISLMHEDGSLSWAFAVDPWIKAMRFLPDREKPVKDAYQNVPATVAYRAKQECVIFGECYIPMISDWYRTGAGQRVTGGFSLCPLIYADRTERVESQGGACDNDVHEIFKCLEETLMDKAFLIVRGDMLQCYGTPLNGSTLCLSDDIKELHINADQDFRLTVNGTEKVFHKGLYFVKI